MKGRAWTGPGRMLGYVLDIRWGINGGDGEEVSGYNLVAGETVAAGSLVLEWWDPDRGERLGSSRISHPGGRLVLPTPAFRRHLAFKLRRE